jgi:hypothetical protein
MWVKVRPDFGSATFANLDIARAPRLSVYQRSGQGWSVNVDPSGQLFDNTHVTQAEAEAEMLALIRLDGIRWMRAEDGAYLNLALPSQLQVVDDGGWRIRGGNAPTGSTNGATVYASQAEATAALVELVAALGEWVYP